MAGREHASWKLVGRTKVRGYSWAVEVSPTWTVYAKTRADALLIASAPEANAACEELIKGDGTAESLQRAIDFARAALIKAGRI